MTPRDTTPFVANDNRRPSLRRRVGACLFLALDEVSVADIFDRAMIDWTGFQQDECFLWRSGGTRLVVRINDWLGLQDDLAARRGEGLK